MWAMRNGPRAYLQDSPNNTTIRLGGRYVNINRMQVELGLDHGYLSRILSGKSVPSVTYLKRVADAFRMSMDDLLECIEDRKQELARNRRRSLSL